MKMHIRFKYLIHICTVLTLMTGTGCQTTPETAAPGQSATAGKPADSKSGTKQTKPASGKPESIGLFRQPDDSWTYLKITATDETSRDSVAQGYVAMTKGEFRFLMEGDYINARVYVSGNRGKISVTGVNSAEWEGILDMKTPIQLQPFFMLAQAFELAKYTPAESPGVRFSFRGLKGDPVEVGQVFFGNMSQGRFFPSDMVIEFLKTKMQISLLIEE